MPSPRRRALGSRRTYPSLAQVLELRAGPFYGRSRFASDAARAEAWEAHGATVLARMNQDQRQACWALHTFGHPPNWTPEAEREATAAQAEADAERRRSRLLAEEFTEPS